MLVKIGDKIYSPNDEPIMIVLSDTDKETIRNMADDAQKYCLYPKGYDDEEVEKFMDMREDA